MYLPIEFGTDWGVPNETSSRRKIVLQPRLSMLQRLKGNSSDKVRAQTFKMGATVKFYLFIYLFISLFLYFFIYLFIYLFIDFISFIYFFF